jgi:hypothetical protein
LDSAGSLAERRWRGRQGSIRGWNSSRKRWGRNETFWDDCPFKGFFTIFLASCHHLFGPLVVFPRLFFLVTQFCLYRFASLDPWYLRSISSACSASFFVSHPFVLFFYTILFLSSFLSSFLFFLFSSLSSFFSLSRHFPPTHHITHSPSPIDQVSQLTNSCGLTPPYRVSTLTPSFVRFLPSHCLSPAMTPTNGYSS